MKLNIRKWKLEITLYHVMCFVKHVLKCLEKLFCLISVFSYVAENTLNIEGPVS